MSWTCHVCGATFGTLRGGICTECNRPTCINRFGVKIPDFKQYAIADGIYKVLFASRTGIIPALTRSRDNGQLLFPFAAELS